MPNDNRGAVKLVTAPVLEPLTRDEAKEHVRLDIDDDTYVDALIQVARQQVETITGLALITQTVDYMLDRFPSSGVIYLPRAPVQSISSVSYIDSAGVAQTWSSSNYIADVNFSPPRLTLAPNKSWPTIQDRIAAVTVRFIAGFGLTGQSVPGPIKQAMKLLLGHYYDHREEVFDSVGANIVALPKAAEYLLANQRIGYF